jgi:hypothetical protein
MNKSWPSIVVATGASFLPLAVFRVLVAISPGVAPGLFWMVPLGVAIGYAILWRRYPAYSYPIGLLFVPLMGGLLLAVAVQIWWYVLGGYI